MRLFVLGIFVVLAFNLIKSSPEESFDSETFSDAMPKIQKKLANTISNREMIVEPSNKNLNKINNSSVESLDNKKELVSCEPLNILVCEDCGGIDCRQLNVKIKREVLFSLLGEEIPDADLLYEMRSEQFDKLLESFVYEKYKGEEPFHIVWQKALREELSHYSCLTYEQYCYDYVMQMEENRKEELRADIEPAEYGFEF